MRYGLLVYKLYRVYKFTNKLVVFLVQRRTSTKMVRIFLYIIYLFIFFHKCTLLVFSVCVCMPACICTEYVVLSENYTESHLVGNHLVDNDQIHNQ